MEELDNIEQKIAKIEAELSSLDKRRNQLLDELDQLKSSSAQLSSHFKQPVINDQSFENEKIHLFRSLFKGREDVFPRRFENAKTERSGYAPVCRNEWVTGVCQKPKIACHNCNSRAFVPISDDIIRCHLKGYDPRNHSGRDFTIRVYPLLTDETCWFMAVDFDKSSWAEDSKAFLETCIPY